MKSQEARDILRKILEMGGATVPIAASYYLSSILAKEVVGGASTPPVEYDLLSEVKGARTSLRASLSKRGI